MPNSILDQMQQMGHEQVVFCQDPATGLNAIIAIHNTTLGPSLGGTRLWNYNSHEDAIIDALRLSRGMTYKSAISGLNLGGGKAVLIGDAATLKSEVYWRRYGKFVNSLNGKYTTAEDVNTTKGDMEYIGMETKFVVGKAEEMGGSGDPSPVTAYGVYMGMKAAAMKAFGSDVLTGKRIMVQGAGNVGSYLMGYLAAENAVIYTCDINKKKLKNIVAKYPGVQVVEGDTIFDLEYDIYAPCALGATINTESIQKMKCPVIAGGANNQLEDEDVHGPMLVEKGITYVPDFLINAGGIINVSIEIDGYNKERAMNTVARIYDRTLAIFDMAEAEGIHTQLAAMRMAEKRMEAVARLKVGV